MSQRGVRVVVGEGQSTRRGLLRFVLEGEGYQVVGQATTSADLARVLAIEKPDAVILDDGIGATAVQVAREASPTSKVVLVWPAGVVPVGGDARVEPGQVMRQLGPAVAALTVGLAPRQEGALKQPEWVARVRKGPSALRERLARAKLAGAAAAAAAAPLVILPGEAAAAAEPTLVLTDQGAAAASGGAAAAGTGAAAAAAAGGARSVAPGPDIAARNQALGNLGLGGAAVVGALALSLAIVGGRMPTDVVDVSGPSLAPSTGTPPPITPTPSPSASVSSGTVAPSVTGGGSTGGGTPIGGGFTGGPTGGGTGTPTNPPATSSSSSHTPPPSYPPSPTGSSPTEPPSPTYPPSPSVLAGAPAVGIITFVAERHHGRTTARRHHHKR